MYATGTPLIASPHAVSCSLPTIESVVGYEEKDSAVWDLMGVGYPRFVQNPLIAKYLTWFRRHKEIDRQWVCFAVTTEWVMGQIENRFASILGHWAVHGFHIIAIDTEPQVLSAVKAFLQHTGTQISSRQAEDGLCAEGQQSFPHYEARLPIDRAESVVVEKIASLQQVSSAAVQLATGGMNAIYHLLEAIDRESPEGLFLYIGWLYTDTLSIFQKDYPEKSRSILCVDDWESIEAAFRDPEISVKGVLTEVPTNPLMQTIDLRRLYALCKHNGAYLIVDPSVSGLANVCLKEHCDIAVCSLTKYFGSGCDLLAGALVYHSSRGEKLKKKIENYLDPLFARDLQRLGFLTQDLDDLTPIINQNALQIAARLAEHPSVEAVFHPYQEGSRSFYQQVAGAEAPGALISYTLKKNWEAYYDQVLIAKGPSFGVTFSILCPYVYLAHYQAAKKQLLPPMIPPDLLRLSVGIEPLEEIWTKISAPLS